MYPAIYDDLKTNVFSQGRHKDAMVSHILEIRMVNTSDTSKLPFLTY